MHVNGTALRRNCPPVRSPSAADVAHSIPSQLLHLPTNMSVSGRHFGSEEGTSRIDYRSKSKIIRALSPSGRA